MGRVEFRQNFLHNERDISTMIAITFVQATQISLKNSKYILHLIFPKNRILLCRCELGTVDYQ